MVEITLINPPSPPGTVSNKDMMGGLGQIYSDPSVKTRMPIIDIAYTAAVLKKAGVPFEVLDCVNGNLNESLFLKEMARKRMKYIGVRTSTPTIDYDLDIVKKIKGIHSGALIYLFGAHIGCEPERILSHPAVDGIVLREPEYTFFELLSASCNNVQGIWHKRDNKITKNPERKLIEDLDSLPFPAWEYFPFNNFTIGDETPFFTILTSRGCPFACGYCPYPITQGRKWRVRSPNSVVDEIEYLIKDFNMRGLLFRDPEFSLNLKRVEEICHEIIRRNLKFSWRCETRIDTLNKPILKLMYEAGCRHINFGIESTNEAVLKNMDRKIITRDQILNIVNFCHKQGIQTFAFFIIGLPGETRKDILSTVRFAMQLNPTKVQFTAATPYYGTRLHNWAAEKGYIMDNSLEKQSGFTAVMRNEYLSTQEIDHLIQYANGRWKYRKYEVIKQIKNIVKSLIFVFQSLLVFFKGDRTSSCKS